MKGIEGMWDLDGWLLTANDEVWMSKQFRRSSMNGSDWRQSCVGSDAPLESKTSRSFFVSMSGV